MTDFEYWSLLILSCSILFLFVYITRRNELKQKILEEKLQERLSQSRINDIDIMDGVEFEKYLEVLFKRLGIRAIRTQASNDFGADLILEGKERVVVQAKRYQKKVGIRAVQEINSARDFYKAQEAWVITNNFFTTPAKELAESTKVKLIDRYGLVDMILNSKHTSENKDVLKHY